MEAIYSAVVTSVGGRSGHVVSSDEVLDFEVRMPKEMGGKEEGYTNPEQLFAAGYAACFNGALAHMALLRRLRPKTTVVAKVNIGKKDVGEGFQLSVELAVNVPGVDQKTAEELVHEANQFCPYSNAIRGNVDVKIAVTTNG